MVHLCQRLGSALEDVEPPCVVRVGAADDHGVGDDRRAAIDGGVDQPGGDEHFQAGFKHFRWDAKSGPPYRVLPHTRHLRSHLPESGEDPASVAGRSFCLTCAG